MAHAASGRKILNIIEREDAHMLRIGLANRKNGIYEERQLSLEIKSPIATGAKSTMHTLLLILSRSYVLYEHRNQSALLALSK